jgi:hypothetical protein
MASGYDRCTHFNRTAGGFLLIMAVAGCASADRIDPRQESIDPNTSVIAFSVDHSEVAKGDIWVRPKEIHLRYNDELVIIPLKSKKARPQRILVEVPAQDILLDRFELDSGSGIFWRRYRTRRTQAIRLTQGEINYLGRLEISDIWFEKFADDAVERPIAVTLDFADALEDDLAAWAEDYALLRNRAPVEQVVGLWGGAGYMDLWIDRYVPRTSSLRRNRESGFREPMRGPVPGNEPQR